MGCDGCLHYFSDCPCDHVVQYSHYQDREQCGIDRTDDHSGGHLILSGRLGEFKGPGGLEAKFVNAANQPLRLTTRSVETSLHPVQVTARGTIEQLPEVVKGIDKSKPSILTVKLGGSYTREDWLAYVRTILDQAPIA